MVRLRQRNRFHRGGNEGRPEDVLDDEPAGREDGETPHVVFRRSRSLERQRVRSRPVIWLAALLVLVLTAILLLR